MNARLWVGGLLLALTAMGTTPAVSAELTTEHTEKLVWVDQSLQKVAALYRDKKTDEMKKLIDEIESAVNSLQVANEADASITSRLAPFKARISAARKLSVHVPAVVASATPATKPGAPMPKPGTPRPRPGTPMPMTGGVSFATQVAPILVGKCANCHIRGSRGNFSMATFAALKAGTNGNLTVIKPGQGATSTLVEKMASGEMPPGGNKVTDQELAVITKWIDEGARYDAPGMDETLPLTNLAPNVGNPGGPTLARATGNEKVLFMRDIAPILIDNCFDCHGAPNANDNSDNFGMYRFSDLMRGGRDGAVINPGDAEGSLLVRMLRGTAKAQDNTTRQRMPARRSPLEDAEMTAITTWIAEGAKFDGEDPQMSIDLQFRINVAKKASHEELMAQRATAAKKNWVTANKDSAFDVLETTDFFIIGSVGPARLEEIKAVAEAEREKVAVALKLPAGQPLLKGRLTLYVFNEPFEHWEFSKVVEDREVDHAIKANWSFNYIDAYACVVAPKDSAASAAPLLAEAIVGGYLDACGSEMPRWFAVGASRNLAAKIHPQNPYTKMWEDGLGSAMSSGLKPADVIGTKNLTANGGAISQAFVKDLMKAPTWSALLGNIQKGVRFDGVFAQAYRTQPLPLLTQWMGR